MKMSWAPWTSPWRILAAAIVAIMTTAASGTPTIVALAADSDSSDAGSSYVLLDDGTVWGCGQNSYGELGDAWDASVPSMNASTYPDDTESHERDYFVRVMKDKSGSPFTGVTAISCGVDHTLALTADGTVWAWGENKYGQLGLGNPRDPNTPGPLGSTAPVPVHFATPEPTITAISAGSFYSLARDSCGNVWAWGNNCCGQCGNGGDLWPNASQEWAQNFCCWTPVQVLLLPVPPGYSRTPLTNIAAISASKDGTFQGHSLAVDSGGNAWAWGYDYDGEVGTNTQLSSFCAPYAVPVVTASGTQLTGVKTAQGAIAAGKNHSLAILSSGSSDTVVAWGSNEFGQLGDGKDAHTNPPEFSSSVPVQVLTLVHVNVKAVAAGAGYSAALVGSGTACTEYTWGDNSNGLLGLGTASSFAYNSPQQVTAPVPANALVAVGVGANHCLAASSGAAWAWGGNEDGQMDNLLSDGDPPHWTPLHMINWAPAVLLTSDRDYISPSESVTLTATVTPPPFYPAPVARYDWYANRDYQNAIAHNVTNQTTCQLLLSSVTATTEYAVKVTDIHGLWYMASIVTHVGAYHGPTAAITSTMPAYIYEGWTVNLTATASDTDPGRTLTYAWTQTGGTRATLASATSLNASFVVPFGSLKPGDHAGYRDLEENLTFQFVATDDANPARSSAPVSTSVRCYICGDIDHDGATILADLKLLVAAWNTTPASPNWNLAADLDGDHAVILADLKLLVANWNRFDRDPGTPGQSGLQMAAAVDGAVSDLDSLDPDTDLVNFKLVAVDPITGMEVSSVRASTTQPVEVRLYAQCPTSGLWAVGGDIVADGLAGALSSADQQFAWTTSPALPLWQWTGGAWTQVGTYPNSSMLEGNFAGSPPQVETTTETYDGVEHVTGYTCTPATTGTCAGQISPATEANWYKGGIPGPNGGMTCLGSGQGITITPDASLGANGYVLLGSYTVSVLDDTQPVTLTWQEAEQDTWTICEYYGGWYTSGTQGLYTQIGQISPLKINYPSVTPGPVPPFVYEGWTVSLTAGGFSPAGYTLTYSWTQTGGRTVSDLTVDSSTGSASFTVPTVELTTDVPLKFTVTVDDGHDHTASAEVTVNTYIMGDITHDNTVNNDDTQALMAAWNSGPGYTGPADLDRDGYVNLADLKLINPNWGRTLGDVAITITGNPSYTYEGRAVNLGCTIRSIHGDTPSFTWTQTAGAAVVSPSGADTASYSFTVPTLTYTSDLPLTFTLSVNAGQDGIATKTFNVNAFMLGDINHNNIVNNTGIGNDYSAVHYAADPASYPGDARWNAAADFNGDGVIDSSDESLVPSWNRTLTSPISLTIGDVPSFVYETWPVSLTCSATSARNDTLTYAWTQIWGPAVSLSGADTSSISFTVPTLQILDDEWLGFSVTVSDGHGGSITSEDIWIDAWMMGDVTHDYSVDSNDSAAITAAWGTHPGETNWNAWADLNNDGTVNQSDQDLVDSNLDRYLDYFMQGMSVSLNSSAVLSDQQVDGAVAQPSTTGPVDTYGLTFEQALQQAGLLQEWLNYLSTQGSGQ